MANTNWVILVLVAAVAYMFATSGAQTTTTNIGYQPPVADQCAYAPSVGYTGADSLVPGTTVTAANYSYFLNGAYVGTTAPSVKKGDAWKVLAQFNGFFPAVAEKKIECGVNNFVFSTKNLSTITINIKPGIQATGTTGQFLYNNSGVYNTSATNSTEANITSTRTLTVYIQSQTQKSTGNLLYVLETPASSAANVTSISMSCAGKALSPAVIPSYLSAANANSYRIAWDIPAVENGARLECALQIVPAVGKALSGGIVTTAYVKQTFIDIDGSVKEGIYDTNGNVKYLNLQVAGFGIMGG